MDDVRDLARQRQSRAGATPAASPEPEDPVEQHFSVRVVALQGSLAVAAVILVLLTAPGVGS